MGNELIKSYIIYNFCVWKGSTKLTNEKEREKKKELKKRRRKKGSFVIKIWLHIDHLVIKESLKWQHIFTMIS